MSIISTEAVSNEYIALNSCGRQYLSGEDITLLRPYGRVDYHVLYIEEGVCYATVLGREVVASAGALVFFFPGEKQKYRFRADTPSISHYLHFSGTSPAALLSEIKEGSTRVFHIGKSASIEALLFRLEEEYALSLPKSKEVTQGYLYALLALFMRKITLADSESEEASKKITAICRTMLATLGEDLSISEYARRCHLSESRFTHLFREVMGKSPIRYLTDARLQKAEELLLYSTLSVAEVGEAVGVKNSYYFSRFFKKHTGLSPSEYRTKKQEK